MFGDDAGNAARAQPRTRPLALNAASTRAVNSCLVSPGLTFPKNTFSFAGPFPVLDPSFGFIGWDFLPGLKVEDRTVVSLIRDSYAFLQAIGYHELVKMNIAVGGVEPSAEVRTRAPDAHPVPRTRRAARAAGPVEDGRLTRRLLLIPGPGLVGCQRSRTHARPRPV